MTQDLINDLLAAASPDEELDRKALVAGLTEFTKSIIKTSDEYHFKLFLAADRLEQLAVAVKEATKAKAIAFVEEHLEEDKLTYNFFGEKVTYKISREYEYPPDKLLTTLTTKLELLDEEIKPLTSEKKGIEASIKERQKQLQENLEPVSYTTTLSIAKK